MRTHTPESHRLPAGRARVDGPDTQRCHPTHPAGKERGGGPALPNCTALLWERRGGGPVLHVRHMASRRRKFTQQAEGESSYARVIDAPHISCVRTGVERLPRVLLPRVLGRHHPPEGLGSPCTLGMGGRAQKRHSHRDGSAPRGKGAPTLPTLDIYTYSYICKGQEHIATTQHETTHIETRETCKAPNTSMDTELLLCASH